jgi:hypothetical protein
VRGREAHEISITIHQTRVSVTLDRPTKGRGKSTKRDTDGHQLRFVILSGYDREQEQASWQTGKVGALSSSSKISL